MSIFGAAPNTGDLSSARIVPLHEKAGFLLIGSEVFGYRYQAGTDQLTITSSEGGAVFPALSGADARAALAEIQKLPR